MAPKAQARERGTSTFGTILSKFASTNGTWTSNIVPPMTCYRDFPSKPPRGKKFLKHRKVGKLTPLGNRSVLKNICPMTNDYIGGMTLRLGKTQTHWDTIPHI
jgi:hypothetical protein